MYAELALPRVHYTTSNTNSLPRRKPDAAAVYAKIGHERSLSPPFHTKEPCSPSAQGPFLSPNPSPCSSNTVSSTRTTTQSPPLCSAQLPKQPHQYASHINVPLTMPGLDGHSMGMGLRTVGSAKAAPTGYSLKNIPFGLQEGVPVCLEVPSYTTTQPSGLSIGYDGPIPPPALLEDEENGPSAETPLMKDPKESEV